MQKATFGAMMAAMAVLAGCAAPGRTTTTPTTSPGRDARPAHANASLPAPPKPYSLARHANAEPAESVAVRRLIEQKLQRPALTAAPVRPAEYLVLLAPQGSPMEVTLLSSSGSATWDRAVEASIRQVQTFPSSRNGQRIANLLVFATPARITASPVRVLSKPADAGGRPSYADRIGAAVRPNIWYADADSVPGNPEVELNVTLAPDGKVIEPYVVRSSGIEDWDMAAIAGLLRTGMLPLDIDGKIPQRLRVALRPKE